MAFTSEACCETSVKFTTSKVPDCTVSVLKTQINVSPCFLLKTGISIHFLNSLLISGNSLLFRSNRNRFFKKDLFMRESVCEYVRARWAGTEGESLRQPPQLVGRPMLGSIS